MNGLRRKNDQPELLKLVSKKNLLLSQIQVQKIISSNYQFPLTIQKV
jgi:hypothetical protein